MFGLPEAEIKQALAHANAFMVQAAAAVSEMRETAIQGRVTLATTDAAIARLNALLERLDAAAAGAAAGWQEKK